MQTIGDLARDGFSYEELLEIKRTLEKKGFAARCEFIDLTKPGTEEAAVLVIRKGVDAVLTGGAADGVFEEHLEISKLWDRKALMRKRVVNKHARHNLVIADFDQEPDYPLGKGRVVSFERLRLTQELREGLPRFLENEKAERMIAEANYYYDVSKCYIGFHGDSERRRVIGCRFGESLPLWYQWYKDGNPFQSLFEIVLNHGDLYIMSEKAVGTDWKRKKVPTLRHAAGFAHVLKVCVPAIPAREQEQQ